MKLRLLFIAFCACLFFTQCSFFNNKIVYEFETGSSEFEFQATNEDTVIQSKISLCTYSEINTRKNEPLELEFDYWERLPNVKKLKSIQLTLTTMDNNQPLKPHSSEIRIEYPINEGRQESMTIPNAGQLNKIINWNEVNYEYEFLNVKYKNNQNTVSFHGTEVYNFEEYPEKIKVNITMTWENGERKFETFLLKKKYEKPKRGWDLKY